MNNYWLSWWHKDQGPFELHWPWWISGEGKEGVSVCAAVKAESAWQASNIVHDAYDAKPDQLNMRFIELRPQDWNPFNDRFEKADWMEWEEYDD